MILNDNTEKAQSGLKAFFAWMLSLELDDTLRRDIIELQEYTWQSYGDLQAEIDRLQRENAEFRSAGAGNVIDYDEWLSERGDIQ